MLLLLFCWGPVQSLKWTKNWTWPVRFRTIISSPLGILYPSNQRYCTPWSCRELKLISQRNSAICVDQWSVPWRTGVPRTLSRMAAKAGHSATTWWEVSSSSPQLLHKGSSSSWTITLCLCRKLWPVINCTASLNSFLPFLRSWKGLFANCRKPLISLATISARLPIFIPPAFKSLCVEWLDYTGW